MVQGDPTNRASISDIKRSKWLQGPTYTQEELAKLMKSILGPALEHRY